jgi:hypothetical protein
MKTLNRAERDQLLEQIRLIKKKSLTPEANKLPVKEIRALGIKQEELEDIYRLGLPRIPIARCPFTGELVTKEIDIYGLEGPWWNEFYADLPTQGSPYVVTYCGALNFENKKILRASESSVHEVLIGPEVPYVIPYLLDFPQVKCVIYSTVLLEEAFPVYFMTYFAKPKLLPGQSHQEWLRSHLWYQNETGHTLWEIHNDVWDFNLAPWLEKPGKLLWIHPSDPQMKLCSEPPSDFPYLNLKGRQKFLMLREGKIIEMPIPSGQPYEYGDFFDP